MSPREPLLGSAAHCQEGSIGVEAGLTSGTRPVPWPCLSLSLLLCEMGILLVLMISLCVYENHMEVSLRTCHEEGSFPLPGERGLGMEEEQAE